VAARLVRSSRSRIEEVSVAEPRPAIRTACGREVRIIAAAPSQIGEQSLRINGVATGRFLVLSK
jgi:hypothetical protein